MSSSSSDLTRPSDIQVLQENKSGEDFIIGDVHGMANLLKDTIRLLGESDRLFIVGDLIDKGPDSIEVVNLVYEHRPDGGKKPAIYSIRGNHEHMFLTYAQLKIAKNDVSSMQWWLNSATAGAGWMARLSDVQLRELTAKLTRLPCIIYVEGKKPFIIVHADMPFDDTTLHARISANGSLSPEEIHHASETRSRQPRFGSYRNQQSCLVYHGHDPLIPDISHVFVHEKSNSINLDIASFHRSCLLLVYHKAEQAVLVGKPTQDDKLIHEQIKRINHYLLSPEKKIKRAENMMKQLQQERAQENTVRLVLLNEAIACLIDFCKGEMKDSGLLQISIENMRVFQKDLSQSQRSWFSWFKAKDPSIALTNSIIEDLNCAQKSLNLNFKIRA